MDFGMRVVAHVDCSPTSCLNYWCSASWHVTRWSRESMHTCIHNLGILLCIISHLSIFIYMHILIIWALEWGWIRTSSSPVIGIAVAASTTAVAFFNTSGLSWISSFAIQLQRYSYISIVSICSTPRVYVVVRRIPENTRLTSSESGGMLRMFIAI